MLRIKVEHIVFLLIILITGRCEVVYEPEGLDNDKKIVVINGNIDDYASKVVVTAEYASQFDQSNYEGIKGAQVYLYDSDGQRYRFYTDSLQTFRYLLDISSIDISEDKKYHIYMVTSEGEVFESEQVQFPGHFSVNDFDATIGTYDLITQTSSGDFNTNTLRGLYVDVSVISTDIYPRYFVFKNSVVAQSKYTVTPPGVPFPIVHRCVEYTTLNSFPLVESSIVNNGMHSLVDYELGFLAYFKDNSTKDNDEYATARTVNGWVIISDFYSVSEFSYNYYKKIEEQLSSTESIFDPVPSQIKGNIYCVTNPDQVTLGLFDMSRRIRKYFYYYWMAGNKEFYKYELETYHAPNGRQCADTMPHYDYIERYDLPINN